jgi:hypothetical protein
MLLSFLAMNPSRLETTCKVTLDPGAFSLPDMIPQFLTVLAGIGLWVRADWNSVFPPDETSRTESATAFLE